MPDRSRRRRLQHGRVYGAVEAWLPEPLEGADGVRREAALRLAAELDTGSTPAHAVPRLANALAGLIAAIESERTTGDDLALARRLLGELKLG
jgi:hypothetical protein